MSDAPVSSRSAVVSEGLRRTSATSLISQLYEATNEDVSCFWAQRYAVSFQQTLHLMRGRPLHSKRSPSGGLLAAGDLNHAQIRRTEGGGLFRCDGFTWSQQQVCLSSEASRTAGAQAKIRGRLAAPPSTAKPSPRVYLLRDPPGARQHLLFLFKRGLISRRTLHAGPAQTSHRRYAPADRARRLWETVTPP